MALLELFGFCVFIEALCKFRFTIFDLSCVPVVSIILSRKVDWLTVMLVGAANLR